MRSIFTKLLKSLSRPSPISTQDPDVKRRDLGPTSLRSMAMESGADLVPQSRFGGSRTKKGGGGRGRERRKRDLAKYDCVGQNLDHALTAHARSLTCF